MNQKATRHRPLRRRSSTTTTTESTTELRSELSRGTTLLSSLTGITTSVLAAATLAGGTVTTGRTATLAVTALLLATEHAAGRGVGALLLDVGLGDDLGGEVEPLAEVVETFGGQGVVVPLPGELGLEVAAGGQGLAGLDDLLFGLLILLVMWVV